MISYLSTNTPIRASQLNALTSALDDLFRLRYGDKTPFLYDIDEFGGLFNSESLVVAFGDDTQWKILDILSALPLGFPSAAYDHSVFTTAAAALTVDEYDSALQLAYVDSDPWPLEGSIEAHKVEHESVDHWYCQRNSGVIGYRERFRRFAVLDVFLEALGGTLEWDESWDKYHFLRFHNFDPTTNVVTLPDGSTGTDITLGPFEVKAVRRGYPNGNSWDTTYRYLWAAESGDGIYWDAEPSNPVASMAFFHRALDLWMAFGTEDTASVVGVKPSVHWSNPSTLNEALNASTKVRRYIFHPGRLISWQDASGTPDPVDFTATWSELEAGTNGVKYNTVSLEFEADAGATTPVDVVGVGANCFPQSPVTLPFPIYTLSGFGDPDSPTCLAAVFTLQYAEEDYIDIDTEEVHEVSQAFTFYSLSQFAISGSTSYEFTLAQLIDIQNAATGGDPIEGPNEELGLPTISFGSDGWRIFAYGTQSLPFSKQLVPTAAQLLRCDISSTGFTEHFGVDVTGRQGVRVETRRQGRSISPYVGETDIFDVVTHYGHPDLSGTYGMAGGVEWVESRQATSSSEKRVDSGGPGNWTQTLTGPVFPLADSIDRIVENAADGSWYATNRTDLLAGTTTVEERQKVVRIIVMAEQYNAIAERMNSIMSVVPLTFDDVYYYGGGNSGIEDGTWNPDATWGSGSYRPADWYCAVASSGSRAAELGLTVSSSPDYYVTLSTVRDYADSLGLRFFARRWIGYRQYISGVGIVRTRSSFDDRLFLVTGDPWCGRCCADYDGYYIEPPNMAALPETQQWEELLYCEHSQEDGPAPPSGWALAGDDKVMVILRTWLNYSNDPLLHDSPLRGYEPFSSYDHSTASGSVQVFSASTFDGSVWDPAALNTLCGRSDDTRAPFQVRLVNRFFFRRT